MDAKSITDIFSGISNVFPDFAPGLLPTWGKLALFGIPLCLYLATAMLPFIVFYGLIKGHYGRRSLFERCSRQLGRFITLLNWIFLICVCASFGYFEFTQQASGLLHPILRIGLYAGGGCLLAGAVLWTAVMTGWKGLRGMPVLHGILIFLAGSCLAALPVISLLLGRVYFQAITLSEPLDFQTLVDLFIPSASDPFWLSVLLLHGLEVAAAGGVGLFWLLLRRRIDDYGRDYYVFAAKWCGEWAAWGGWMTLLLLAGIQGAVLFRGDWVLRDGSTLFFMLCLFIPLLLASVIWTAIARSALPMRHKVGMVFALVLLLVSAASGGILLL